MDSFQTQVLIVGAGPVGLTLALDLAARGIASILVEQRGADDPATPRANHVSARAMETFRRLGVADAIRATGLPADFRPDIAWKTSMTGHELTRIRLHSTADVTAPGHADPLWPTPEPQHKINQMFLEPILRAAVAREPRITLLHRVRFHRYAEGEPGVRAWLSDLEGNQRVVIDAAYLVGCDGGSSTVRKAIGARFEGDPALTRVVSLHVRAPGLIDRLGPEPAHRYFMVNPRQAGSVVTLDGRELWSFHAMPPDVESDPAALGHDRAIRALTGIDDLDYAIFAVDSWTGRRLLADRLRKGRVFLCGDAAHIWVPNAGYGMNAGIADAENLGWRLAATLHGWGGSATLDGYERERHPITDQVSNFAKGLAIGNRAARFRSPPPELEQDGAEGEAARREFGAALFELNWPQFNPVGLNFGYFYDASPDICHDGEPAPDYGLGSYTPSTVPGCRAPHFALRDGTSLYDRMGGGHALLLRDRNADPAPLLAAAARVGMPLALLDIADEDVPAAYRHAMLIVRPDRHVAWRGNDAADADAVIARLAGRG